MKPLATIRNALGAIICVLFGHKLETRDGRSFCVRCRRYMTGIP